MNLQSLGHAAAACQRHPKEIRHAIVVVQAEEAYATGDSIPQEAKPTMTLNGIDYFHADEILRAITWLVEREMSQKIKEATDGE